MKYIDSEKLIAEIERRKANAKLYDMSGGDAPIYDELLSFITSLQQEQPMPDSTELIAKWEEEKDALKQMNFRGDGWLLAQNAFMDGFGIGLSVKQEQPEVDLEKELDAYYDSPLWDWETVSWMTYTRIAHHFYELGQRNQYQKDRDGCFWDGVNEGKKAMEAQEVDLEKAARYVYESWMGGTMNDVRRDMVELGKVLNARKEE